MYCILVTGLPASGKSTLARALGEALSLPVLSKDDVKELLFDDVGFDSRAEKVALGVAALDAMFYAARQMLRCGIPVILENNCENATREPLQRLLSDTHATPITVMLTCEPHVLHERFVRRNTSPDRHRGHVVNDHYPERTPGKPVEPPAFDAFWSTMTARGMADFAVDGPRIELDMTHPETADVPALAARIRDIVRTL